MFNKVKILATKVKNQRNEMADAISKFKLVTNDMPMSKIQSLGKGEFFTSGWKSRIEVGVDVGLKYEFTMHRNDGVRDDVVRSNLHCMCRAKKVMAITKIGIAI